MLGKFYHVVRRPGIHGWVVVSVVYCLLSDCSRLSRRRRLTLATSPGTAPSDPPGDPPSPLIALKIKIINAKHIQNTKIHINRSNIFEKKQISPKKKSKFSAFYAGFYAN